MKLIRLPHQPSALIDFFQEGLESLGAICERTWHDRLQVIAEGTTAKLWNDQGVLLEAEVYFPSIDQTAPREADKEVFPGCPLTFRLTEQLLPATLSLDRVLLRPSESGRPPTLDSIERLWQAQFPGSLRWKLDGPLLPAWHFSLLALLRCEIQAIDQHWSLHRLAVSLPDGRRDESLATGLDLLEVRSSAQDKIDWPPPAPERWHGMLAKAIEEELGGELAGIRQRQEQYLRRELDRIDTYFSSYEQELAARAARSHSDASKIKAGDRLAAAKAEHQRRRQDQVQRHEIRVIPHLDALVLLAEPAWEATVSFVRKGEVRSTRAEFNPRARRWVAAIE